MPAVDLNQAIQLIQAGQPEQAQVILQAILRASPQDLPAWSWYVKTCPTAEKRLKALEVCLKFNPDNAEVRAAVQKLQSRLSTVQPAPAPAAPAFVASSTPPVAPAYAAAPAAPADAAPEQAGLDEDSGQPFPWYEVWFRALTQPNAPSYEELLRDPGAGLGRACWWILLAILLAGLVEMLVSVLNPAVTTTLKQFEQIQGDADLSTILIGARVAQILFMPVWAGLGLLGWMLLAFIFHLLAKSFGGSGSFTRTFYLLGTYIAPVSIVSGVLSIIPLASCLTLPLWLYTLWLHVVALQAAQRLNGGRATIVVLITVVVLLTLACVVSILAWSTIQSVFPLPQL